MSALSLDGKVAVVTGSGRGLGRAYAVALASAGAGVVVNDLDEAAAAETLALITDAGGRAVTEIAAVGEADSAQALVDRAKSEFGRLDVMVTNAGLLRDKVLWKMTDEDFDLVIRTHLRGTFLCARAAAISMREQGEGGRIIVVGSPAGQFAAFGQTNYSAAKAGHRRLRAQLGVGARTRPHHRQRNHPGRLDADGRDDPGLRTGGRAARTRSLAARTDTP